MSIIKVKGEQPFQILAHSFAVTPSSEGYTLNYSANGEEYTAWEEATPANETLVVNGVAKLMYFKLVGNQSDVEINF